MLEPETAQLLLKSIATIELCLYSKARFIASVALQDEVFHHLQLIGELSRGIPWGYRNTRIEYAWYHLNGLLMEQHLLTGLQGVDLYKIWKVANANLPIIKQEANFWVKHH